MKFINVNSLLRRMKEECIFKQSDFMDKVILLDQSLYKYYKKYYNKNIYFHPVKYLKYLKLKKAIKNNKNQSYINIYLNLNQGWIKSDFIPKDKENRILEIVNYFGKQMKVKLFDYGFRNIDDDLGCMFGWVCWVQRWRFADERSTEIEFVEYYKKGKKNK